MAKNEPKKYSIVKCVIKKHASYGLIVETLSGDAGYIDSGDISDGPVESRRWPEPGQEITGVVISCLHDGRLVISARPSDISLVRSTVDIQAAMDVWTRLRRADQEYVRAKDDLIASRDIDAVLRWALSRPKLAPEPGIALRALVGAPSGLLLEVMGEMLNLVIQDNHADEVRCAIAAAGTLVSAPAFSREISSLVSTSELNAREYSRLAEALRYLGARRAFDAMIDAMLRSHDLDVRAVGEQYRDSP